MLFCKICWKIYPPWKDHIGFGEHTNALNQHCETCGQEFTSKAAKQRHRDMTVGTPPIAYRCQYCSQIFMGVRKFHKHTEKTCSMREEKPKPMPGNRNASGNQTFNAPSVAPDYRPSSSSAHGHANATYTPATGNATAYIHLDGGMLAKEESDNGSDDDSSSDEDPDGEFVRSNVATAAPGVPAGTSGAPANQNGSNGHAGTSSYHNGHNNGHQSYGCLFNYFTRVVPREYFDPNFTTNFIYTTQDLANGGDCVAAMRKHFKSQPRFKDIMDQAVDWKPYKEGKKKKKWKSKKPKTIPCPHCPSARRMYGTQASLQSHIRAKIHAPIADPVPPSPSPLTNPPNMLNCLLCPPGSKTFKSKSSLKMHIQAKLHGPLAPATQLNGNTNKGKGKAPEGSAGFDEQTYRSGHRGLSLDSIDLVDRELGGMDLAGVPLDMSWAGQVNRGHDEYMEDDTYEESNEYQGYGRNESSGGAGEWGVGV